MAEAHETRFEELERKLRSYLPDPDLPALRAAYEFARDAHEGQLRKSGDPYIGHPVEVAHFTADLHLDLYSVSAALLHDTVEDTSATVEEVRERFGDQVAFLVNGLTKISKLQFKSREEAQAENIRKLIVAMSRDLRVVLVKLADRLHNIHTLEHMHEAGQRRIAQETIDIYAPIANRLGINWLKVQLEDGALRFLQPDGYRMLADRIAMSRREREVYISETSAILQRLMRDAGIQAEIQGRPKHFFSIFRKMEKSQIEFEDVYDVTAFRIIVEDRARCYEALGLVHDLWKPVPGRFKDYVAIPKANGYQSLHTTVIGHKGERVEIQIRTREMHQIAEHGVAAHWAYKEGRSVFSPDSREFQWLRELVANQAEINDSREFLDSVKLDLFNDEVFVFTPDGDLKNLPAGATPLDFAYAIHSEVGHHCTHAKVNGRVVTLRHELQNGDRVEIITRSDQRPREEWVDIVKSSRAKAKIRAYIRLEQKDRARDMAKQWLGTELKRYGLRYETVTRNGDLQAAAELLKFQTVDQLLVAVGYGRIQAATVVSKIVPPEIEPKEQEASNTVKRIGERLASMIGLQRRNAIRLAGVDGEVMVTYARCCTPVPGDDIVGYVTRGRGIVVHVRSCSRMANLEEERQVDVEWSTLKRPEGESTARKVSVRVVSRDERGLLAEMSAAFSSRGVNIAQAHCSTKEDGLATSLFDVLVTDVGQLKEAMKQVGRIDGVVLVERVRT